MGDGRTNFPCFGDLKNSPGAAPEECPGRSHLLLHALPATQHTHVQAILLSVKEVLRKVKRDLPFPRRIGRDPPGASPCQNYPLLQGSAEGSKVGLKWKSLSQDGHWVFICWDSTSVQRSLCSLIIIRSLIIIIDRTLFIAYQVLGELEVK